MSYLNQMSIPFPISVSSAIVLALGVVAIFLSFPFHPAEAASMTFTSDTTITTDMTIGTDQVWTVNPGVKLTIASGVTINIIWSGGPIDHPGGAINNFGTINIDKNARIDNMLGTLNNDGTIINGAGGTIENHSILNNDGTIINKDDGFITTIHINNNGIIINKGGGYILNVGIISNNSGGIITNEGRIDNYSQIFNAGTIFNSGTISFSAYTTGTIIDNKGTICNSGTINITEYTGIFSAGTVNNSGTINNNCGGTFVNTGTFSGNPVNNESCVYSLNLFEGSDPSDGTADLNQKVTAKVETNDKSFGGSIYKVTFRWNHPPGVPVYVKTVPLSFPGQAVNTFTPNEVGVWTVEAEFNYGIVIPKSLYIDFLVVPESPIGLIGLVGSSFAALGAYMKFSPKVSS